VPKTFTILIADRNPHVRGFLQREMSKEGYRVRLAESAQDLLQWAFNHEPINLIILDPDLPDAVDAHLLNTLQNRTPPVPVIIHTHYAQSLPETRTPFIVVEKGGSSVERLKQITESLLRQQPPE
jgi:DNA-binding NtrC family response regulator